MSKNASGKNSDGPDPIDIHVGSRLRTRRNLLGISQEQMAKALGLTFQQIQKYERAANRMSASRLHQISRLLNVPEQWFFDEAPKESLGLQGFSDNKQLPLDNAPNAETDPMQRRETFDLVRAYYSIADAKQRRKVLELIRSMAESEK